MGSELGLTADTRAEIVLTKVNVWWICWTIVWSLVVATGMAFLITKRNLPVLRNRSICLSLGAVALLHLYWISVQLGVVIGPLYPGDTEFWIMSTYLPLGIGLFHAANIRFLYVAQKQRDYFAHRRSHHNATAEPKESKETKRAKGGLWFKVNSLEYTSRVLVYVGIGMAVQLFLTILMYCISRKYHDSWGIHGTEIHGTEMEKKVQMGRGWEWWPSVVWLFFWGWIVAPYVLWKSRNIHDTQGWRLQTVGCAMATLHAAPMWLVALYVPAMEKVNLYWIPPQWIAVSIWIIEILTVFLPSWEVLRHQSLKKETLDAIAQWEAKRHSGHRIRSNRSSSTAIESIKTGWNSVNGSLKSASGESVYTMSALEYVLEKNPEPLQKFSALRDFSGENIAFLTSVGDWKSALPKEDANLPEESRKELIRERFNRALRIYTEFISSRDAEFQINLSSGQLRKLETVFEDSARAMCGEQRRRDLATPFEVPKWEKSHDVISSARPNPDSDDSTAGRPSNSSGSSGSIDHTQFWGEIPDSFDEHVFDDAEKSIKYLVLTNTWPKFVRDRRTSLASLDAPADGQDTLPVTLIGGINA